MVVAVKELHVTICRRVLFDSVALSGSVEELSVEVVKIDTLTRIMAKNKKGKRPKSDVASLKAELPVKNNKGRRGYLMGALRSVATLPLNTVIVANNNIKAKAALQQMRKLAQGFDLEKAKECIALMKKFESSTDIMALGCATLASIAINESAGLVQIGVVDVIVSSMEKHADADRVQASASLLVWNLAVTDEHKKMLAGHGLDEMLLKALKAHEKAQAVQHMAIGAVKILANDKDIKTSLAKKGAIELIMKAMKTFTADNPEQRKSIAAMTETCISALQNFAFGPDHVANLMRLGAGRHIIAAMNKYTDDAEIQSSGCGALWNLGIPKENKLELAEMGGTVAVVNALREFTESESVVLNGVGALKNLLILPASLAVFKIGNDRKEVIQVLEKCCVVHGDHNDINRIGLELLQILYDEGELDGDMDDDDDESEVNIDD